MLPNLKVWTPMLPNLKVWIPMLPNLKVWTPMLNLTALTPARGNLKNPFTNYLKNPI